MEECVANYIHFSSHNKTTIIEKKIKILKQLLKTTETVTFFKKNNK